jgi:hypothetical protein
MFRKLFFAVMLSVCAFAALALPKPSEVKAAFASGNYVLAENLLKQVMVEKPTAMVHYQLGQVYAAEGKHPAALNEYRQAQALDPTLQFASNANVFINSLNTEQKLATVPVPSPPMNWAIVFGVIFIIALVIAMLAAFYTKASKKKELAVAKKLQTEKTNTLIGLLKSLDDATLIAKTSNHSSTMTTQLIDNIIDAQSRVRKIVAELKDNGNVTESRIQSISDTVSTVVAQAASGIPQPTSPDYADPIRASHLSHNYPKKSASNPIYRAPAPQITPTPAPSPTVVHHYHEPVHTTSNSGNDLLTGVLIGEAISNHRDRTVYVERDSSFDQGRNRSRNDTYEVPTYTPPPVFDEPTRYSAPADDSWDNSSSSIDSSSSSSSDDSY